MTGRGVPELWEAIAARWTAARDSGALAERRRAQDVRWLQTLVREGVLERFLATPGVEARLRAAEAAVSAGGSPLAAALEVLGAE